MLFMIPTVLASPTPLVFPSSASCTGHAVDVAMVGDVMQHGEQLKASTRADGTHTWQGVFDAVAPLLRDADLAIANLETPIDPAQPFGGYPFFNAPIALLDALSEAGVDVLQTANNHCLDRGRSGALATLDNIRRHGFLTAGTWASAEERSTPWVLSTLDDGITVAFLANTYGTNGQPMPAGEPWLVNWLDEGQMQHDVHRARAVADIVIVGLHWGGEYRHAPVEWQRTMARSLVDAGADVVMGSHPHVLQPAEVITVDDLNGPRDGLILYSLGNFVSNQRTFPRDGGVIARATLQRCNDQVRVVDAAFTPVWVDDRVQGAARKAFRLYPVPPADAACIGDDRTELDCRRMASFRDHAASLLPAEHFSWTSGDHGRLARRPVGSWPDSLDEGLLPPVVPPIDVWPPRSLTRTQADP